MFYTKVTYSQKQIEGHFIRDI